VIAFAPWQALLDALGWVLAQIYALIPNYGVTIIVLTVVIRVILLPLGIKQIRSMQHMQLVQPKVKQIQQKYKQNKAKQQEEIMKLYKEYGVNPFSGCWPVLLQFPILIAMYSVLRHPQHPVHIPQGSELQQVIDQQIPQPATPEKLAELPGPPGGTTFLWMNLLCSATQAGNPEAQLADNRTTAEGEKVVYPVDCGNTTADRIPYYIFVVLMFGTTYYQQRQMQKASPPGAASQQQQALLRLMPLMFGIFGIFFPSGLVLYWTTSNVWQIGQQYFMLKSRPTAEMLAARAAEKGNSRGGKKGFMSSMMERADEERKRRDQATRKPGQSRKPGSGKPGSGKPGSGKPRPPGGGKGPTGGRGGTPGKGRTDQGSAGKGGTTGGDRREPDTGDDGGTDPGDRPER
jgi:YidC/Oxa1 family membrane protein insertase